MQATAIRWQWRPDTEGGDFAQKCYSASHYYDKIPGIISEDKIFDSWCWRFQSENGSLDL